MKGSDGQENLGTTSNQVVPSFDKRQPCHPRTTQVYRKAHPTRSQVEYHTGTAPRATGLHAVRERFRICNV
jgi:hypothetical protein